MRISKYLGQLLRTNYHLFAVLIVCCLAQSSCDDKTTHVDEHGRPIDSTLQALNERITQDPNSIAPYLERAKYFRDHKNFPLAYQDLKRAASIDSTFADIYAIGGDTYFTEYRTLASKGAKSDLDHYIHQAFLQYEKCLRFDSTHVEGLLQKSEIDILLRDYPTAMKQINRALRKNQYLPKAYFLKGQLYRETGDSTLALSSFKTAIEVDPNYYDAFMALGLLYGQSKSDLGRQYFDAAISIKPNSIEAWYGKAMFLQESGYREPARYAQAFACYDSILRIQSDFSAANFNKGFIHLEYLQHYDTAATFFTLATEQFPEYYQAFYNRGLCYESLGNSASAEKDYRQALALRPTYDDAAIALNRVLGKRH
ncbi:MAG: tetratricopeptide repeat protein [Flavobacteriales bacterium]